MVKLKWGMEYKGYLVSVDGYMNMQVRCEGRGEDPRREGLGGGSEGSVEGAGSPGPARLLWGGWAAGKPAICVAKRLGYFALKSLPSCAGSSSQACEHRGVHRRCAVRTPG